MPRAVSRGMTAFFAGDATNTSPTGTVGASTLDRRGGNSRHVTACVNALPRETTWLPRLRRGDVPRWDSTSVDAGPAGFVVTQLEASEPASKPTVAAPAPPTNPQRVLRCVFNAHPVWHQDDECVVVGTGARSPLQAHRPLRRFHLRATSVCAVPGCEPGTCRQQSLEDLACSSSSDR